MLDYLTNVFIKSFLFLYSTTETWTKGQGGGGEGLLLATREEEEQDEEEMGGKEKRSFIIYCNFVVFFMKFI